MAEQRSGTVKDTGDKLLDKRGGDILIKVDAGDVEVDPQTAKEVFQTVVADHAKVVDFQTREEQVSKSAIPGNMEAVISTGFKVSWKSGGELSFAISTDSVEVAKEVCRTAITLGALYVGYQLLRPVVDAAVKKALGGERKDQEVKDIMPGSLHAVLHCSTDERFLEVLWDYESGAMKGHFQKEFLQAGIKVKELEVEIENKEEVNKKKEAIEKRSHIKRNLCEDVKNPAAGDAESDMKKEMISEARSLALQFMSENSSCIRAIPYQSEHAKSLTMCLYMDTNGKRIPDTIYDAAQEMFKGYTIEVDDLYQRPLNKITRQPPASQKQKAKILADLSRTIEKNLHLFDNRMNITAVKASYKVTDSIEQDIPCVTVYVLSKGKIPAGETDINEIKEENGDVFNEIEFDVAEGYYKMTTGPSLEDYAKRLQGGVGIGVKGVNGAGTLGGFLEDEKGNVYILSNEHVLHPPDAAEYIIVQPSKLDYDYKRSTSQKKITQLTGKIEKIWKLNKEPSKLVLEELESDRDEETKRLVKIESKKPRPIGRYVCGVKNNHALGGINVYVDAAIAMLDKKEWSAMKEHKKLEVEATRCPLYGFETEKYWDPEDSNYHPPNGEIIDLESFQTHVREEWEREKERSRTPSKLRFMKIGKSTGFKDEGCFDIPHEQIHLNIIAPEVIPGLVRTPYSFCERCIKLEHPNYQLEKNEPNVRSCKRCGKEFEKPGQVRTSWAKNCYLVRKRSDPFSKKGDSGALVFDKEGRAWGLVFGLFDDLSQHRPSLISPLCVALDALKQELKRRHGPRELKLWCTTKEEPTHEMQNTQATS